MTDPVVLSGLRPTGRVHLGNYFGAVKNWVDLQNSGKYRCFFFVADLHALTTDYADTGTLAAHTRDAVLDWLAVGLDPERATVFLQSRVPQHAELALYFSMITPLGWLERVPDLQGPDRRAPLAGPRDARVPGLPGPHDRRHRGLPREPGPGRRGPGEPPRDLPRDRAAIQRPLRRGLPGAEGPAHADAEGQRRRRAEDVEVVRQHDRDLGVRRGRPRQGDGDGDGPGPRSAAGPRKPRPLQPLPVPRPLLAARRRSRSSTSSAGRPPAAAWTARST